ncbi:1114_t:CDS:2 [Rhizophagus irregularis]|nr:1114_t:CDS:2 [Rhizophagus irregularis]
MVAMMEIIVMVKVAMARIIVMTEAMKSASNFDIWINLVKTAVGASTKVAGVVGKIEASANRRFLVHKL